MLWYMEKGRIGINKFNWKIKINTFTFERLLRIIYIHVYSINKGLNLQIINLVPILDVPKYQMVSKRNPYNCEWKHLPSKSFIGSFLYWWNCTMWSSILQGHLIYWKLSWKLWNITKLVFNDLAPDVYCRLYQENLRQKRAMVTYGRLKIGFITSVFPDPYWLIKRNP